MARTKKKDKGKCGEGSSKGFTPKIGIGYWCHEDNTGKYKIIFDNFKRVGDNVELNMTVTGQVDKNHGIPNVGTSIHYGGPNYSITNNRNNLSDAEFIFSKTREGLIDLVKKAKKTEY